MEGPPINSDYLGYSTLSKPATGVGILQQPIRDLYLKFRKPGKGAPPVRRVVLRLAPGGLSVTLIDQRGANSGELFFDISSFTYFEVLRFTVLKPEKKPKCIFMPLDESKMPNKEKAAFVLDKSYASLAQASHPPLLACVLRRPKGVKALDCHVFVLENLDDAIHLQSGLMTMQSRGVPGDMAGADPAFSRGQHGDFVRGAEFGEYGMYRSGGGQPVELRDDHFRGGGQEPGWGPEGPGGEVQMRGGPGSTGGGGGDRMSGRSSSGYDPMAPQMQFPPRQDFERNEMVAHIRQRSSDSGDNRFLNMSYNEGERPPSYTGLPDSKAPQPGRYSDKQPPRVADKPLSPSHQPGPQYNVVPPQQQQRPLSPRHGQTFAPEFSASSAEARNSRELEPESSGGRPVAKVPPHKVAGIKVLPTGFMPQLKPKSPRDDKPRNLASDRNSGDLDKSRDFDKGRDLYDGRGSDYDKGRNPESDYDNAGFRRGPNYGHPGAPESGPQQDYKSNWSRENSFNDPGLRSGFEPPRYGGVGVRVGDDYGRYPPGGDDPRYGGGPPDLRYGGGGGYDDRQRYSAPEERVMVGAPEDRSRYGGYGGVDDRGRYGGPGEERGGWYGPPPDRRYIESYDDQVTRVQVRGGLDYSRGGPGGPDPRGPGGPGPANRYSMPSAMGGYDRGGPGPMTKGSASSYDMSGRPLDSGDPNVRKKEQEIADMFRNFQVGDERGANFEQSLGYLP